ncbi:PrgI family protein [Candidatus Peregrinibacteria bacterium]|jgi:hypothetical protein|nr:PrgI family protein [Candidatus Peregrinibacteria bacterium]MBT7736433.1 PrgI family protein [Candidatus Peregrinibacteria bacterium]
MRFKVPQEVQREDTIIGPLTLKQMGILGVGGGIAYTIYIGLAKTYFMEIWLPPVLIVSAITLAFTFLRIHDLPFHKFVMNYIEYLVLPRQRIWIQGSDTHYEKFLAEAPKKIKKEKKEDKKPKKSIEELTQVLDSHGENQLTQGEKKEKLNEIVNKNYKK